MSESKQAESKGNEDVEVPPSFICPISQAIMSDPYIDMDGNSYEKTAIMEWLSLKNISPITRNPMTVSQLVPNRGLKTMIEDFLRSHPEAKESHHTPVDITASVTQHMEALSTRSSSLDREPLILFAVIDNSGSMQQSCSESTPGKEDDGYSRLDLVKHTLNTIVTALTEEDQICIIKFHTVADVFTPLMYTNASNKEQIKRRLIDLEAENQTNIWDGLRLAFDRILDLPAHEYRGKNVQIYLLTDGEPTIHPPKPMDEIIPLYMRKFPQDLKPVINTFGYGYSLDSKMLLEICQVGNKGGVFGFLPDASMVGTVFINALSNSLLAKQHQEQLESQRQQQSHESYENVMQKFSDELVRVIRLMLHQNASEDERARVLATFVTEVKDYMREFYDESSPSNRNMQTTKYEREKSFLQDLITDCDCTTDANVGQIEKATKPQYFNKWGKHYLRSVLTAYHNQLCINFKDKGVQSFKTNRFIEEQSRVEDIFISLPPPKPSNAYQSRGHYFRMGNGPSAAPAASAAAPVNMRTYYNVSGGCFTKDSIVISTLNGKKKINVTIGECKAGTSVYSLQGWTKIEAVVQLKYSGDVYQVGSGMTLTPYHPVMLHGKSFFPIDLYENPALQLAYGLKIVKKSMVDDYVYDFILANRSILASPLDSQKDFFVATFGHNVQEGIFQHAYFGNEAIVKDLQVHPNYQKGHVTLEKPQFVRDPFSQEVVKLTFC